MSFNVTVTEYIENAPAIHKDKLETIRKLIHKSVAGVTEEIKWGFPVFKKSKDFTYLRAAKGHVTLGFYNFERIQDVEGLLEGSGTTMRHIKIGPTDDINEDLLAEWLIAIAGQ